MSREQAGSRPTCYGCGAVVLTPIHVVEIRGPGTIEAFVSCTPGFAIDPPHPPTYR